MTGSVIGVIESVTVRHAYYTRYHFHTCTITWTDPAGVVHGREIAVVEEFLHRRPSSSSAQPPTGPAAPTAINRGVELPPSCHRLGPRDMALEAKRSRHVAVAIPVFAIAGIVTVSPSQKSTESQQPDVEHHETLTAGADANSNVPGRAEKVWLSPYSFALAWPSWA